MDPGYLIRLRQALEDIPATEISKRIYVHKNTVLNWLNGKTEMSIGSFITLVEAYDLDANYIVKGVKTEKEKPYGYKRR